MIKCWYIGVFQYFPAFTAKYLANAHGSSSSHSNGLIGIELSLNHGLILIEIIIESAAIAICTINHY